MALKTKVKVGNITSLSEARYCAGMEVDFLGFPFYSDFETDYKRFTEISNWVSGPKLVIECIEAETIKRVIDENVEATYIQLDLRFLNPKQIASYKLFILVPDFPTPEMFETLDLVRGQGHCILVTLVGYQNCKEHVDGFLVFMEKGDEPDVDKILSNPIDGIFLKGDAEIKPGIQDYSTLTTILEKLEVNED